MKNILKNYKFIMVIIIDIIATSLLLSLLNLINLINGNITSILIMINTLILFLYLGLYFGKKTEKKGFLTGIKVGLVGVTIMFLISLIFFKVGPNLSMILYYLILLFASIMGSMIGINKKTN